jgi:hypothetical protein
MVMPGLAGGVIGYVIAEVVDGKQQITITPTVPAQAQEKIIGAQALNYRIQTIDLSVARTGIASEEFKISGDFLQVATIGGKASIVFNEPDNQPIPLEKGVTFHTAFYRFFIVNAAQLGVTMTLNIGKGGTFRIEYPAKPSATGDPTTVFNAAFGVLPAATYYTPFVDLRVGQRLVFMITNTLDQPVTVQAVGQIRDIALPGDVAYIGLPTNVIALTGVRSVGISDVYWHPFVALEIIQPGVVTVGSLLIEAVVQG